jgi:hypothetical protein
VRHACLHHLLRRTQRSEIQFPPNDPALNVTGLSVYVGNVPGTSKVGEEVLPMNRGLIGTIIGILVIIILVIVILQLT